MEKVRRKLSEWGNEILWMEIDHIETMLNHVDREEEIKGVIS
jgi:hypothetical protein